MNRFRLKLFTAAVLILAGVSSAPAAENTRILFIGNSYTGQVRKAVTALVAASPHGKTTEMEFITPGGKTLEFHLKNEATTSRIAEGDWDFVVLQDQSQTYAVPPASIPVRYRLLLPIVSVW